MRWTIHLEGGPQRVNHAAVTVGSHIYSFGGFSPFWRRGVIRKNASRNMDIYILDTDTLRWSPVLYIPNAEVPSKRYGHTVVAYDRKIYLWGGESYYGASDILYCFDVDTCTWSIPNTTGVPPLAADGHSACVINGNMYIYGGVQFHTERYVQSVYTLNLITLVWEEIETFDTPPLSRDFHTASAIGSRMYIFGGRSMTDNIFDEDKSDFYFNNIMYFDTENKKWYTPKTIGRPPCGRRSHSATVFENKLYIFGGYDGVSQNHLNDFYQFDPVKEEWTELICQGKGPCPRRRHCACVVKRQLFLFGGTSPQASGEDFQKLIENSDLHVLDFFPTLKRLCQLETIKYGIKCDLLPKLLIQEMKCMTTNNIITRNDLFSSKDYKEYSLSPRMLSN